MSKTHIPQTERKITLEWVSVCTHISNSVHPLLKHTDIGESPEKAAVSFADNIRFCTIWKTIYLAILMEGYLCKVY